MDHPLRTHHRHLSFPGSSSQVHCTPHLPPHLLTHKSLPTPHASNPPCYNPPLQPTAQTFQSPVNVESLSIFLSPPYHPSITPYHLSITPYRPHITPYHPPITSLSPFYHPLSPFYHPPITPLSSSFHTLVFSIVLPPIS